MGSRSKAIEAAQSQGYQGIEYFDYETGEGIEEMEVLILPKFVNVYSVNYIDPSDFPHISEEY